MDNSNSDKRQDLASALHNLRSALEQLDASGAPAHIGAHVDLAIHQLEADLAATAPDGAPAQIDTKAEPQ